MLQIIITKYVQKSTQWLSWWDIVLQARRSQVRPDCVIVIFHWHNPSGYTNWSWSRFIL